MKKIRIGVLGGGRGADMGKDFMLLGCDVVAICDFRPERLKRGAEVLGNSVKLFDDFDKFLDCGLDAVVIANYFHEHAPYAIKCLERNIHVYSECISNGTMAEGIELYDAFKKSKSIYMLAENYPQMKFNREIKRICDGGTIGKIMYAEGEYNHPSDPFDTAVTKRYVYFENHWRNYLPQTYYITHSLGPIMWASGATPKTVTAFSIFMPKEGDIPSATQTGDRTAIIMTHNDDESVFKVTGCASFGAHGNSYRVCGTKGQIENLRGMGEQVMLRYNEWEIPEGMKEINFYEPEWNDKDEELIVQSGHGGGDYLTSRMFLECIEKGVQPEHPFDIKSAIAMSSVAILAHRSALEGGKPYAIPDFDNPEDRALYENDRLSPFVYSDGTQPTLPCCSHTDFKANEEQLQLYKEILGIK